jgi:3-isopropylmalate/(R)-2-methylmalate dehydratase small subunit
MILTGSAICFKDNINTDEIIPGRYLSINDPNQLAHHTFEDIHPNFLENMKKITIIVAGKNFGCGSSREQAPVCLKHAGVQAIIAESFARIFFRNAINIGLPVVELSKATKNINQDDKLKIHMKSGIIENFSTQNKHKFHQLPEWMLEMIDAGGYISWSQKKVKREMNHPDSYS